MISDGEYLFMCVSHLEVFGKASIHVVCTFLKDYVFFWVLSFISSLYIWDTNPLSDMSFANIFSYSVGCLLILLPASFTVQKLFILM